MVVRAVYFVVSYDILEEEAADDDKAKDVAAKLIADNLGMTDSEPREVLSNLGDFYVGVMPSEEESSKKFKEVTETIEKMVGGTASN